MVLPPEFQRFRSVSALLRPPLLTAAIISIPAGLLPIFASVCLAVAVSILLPEQHPDGGFRLFGQLVQLPDATRQLSPRLLVILLSTTAAVGILLHFLVILDIRRRTASSAAMESAKLQQALHRRALRLQPADLNGRLTAQAEVLSSSLLPQSEIEIADWSWRNLCVITQLPLAGLFLLGTEWQPALQAAIPLIAGQYLLSRLRRYHLDELKGPREQFAAEQQALSATFSRARVVTSYGLEDKEQELFQARLQNLRLRTLELLRRQQFSQTVQFMIQLLMLALPTLLICLQLKSGLLPATAVCMTCLLAVLQQNLFKLFGSPASERSATEELSQLSAFLNITPPVSQTPGATFLQPLSRTLTFDQVSFESLEQPALLKKLDLRISAGERIAIISTNPLAAQAVVAMLPRFLDPESGQILFDGRNINHATLESLRAEVVFVSSNDPVFSATALENLTCGQPDLTRQKAIEAAKITHADSFLRTLRLGYDTQLGEQATELLPIQAFRLGLARAALRDPALLIIEEPKQRMEKADKDLLDDTVQRLSNGRTVITLPGRLSTLRQCDRIILIHEGRVAAEGSHERLLQSSELYRHWEYMHFNSWRGEQDR